MQRKREGVQQRKCANCFVIVQQVSSPRSPKTVFSSSFSGPIFLFLFPLLFPHHLSKLQGMKNINSVFTLSLATFNASPQTTKEALTAFKESLGNRLSFNEFEIEVLRKVKWEETAPHFQSHEVCSCLKMGEQIRERDVVLPYLLLNKRSAYKKVLQMMNYSVCHIELDPLFPFLFLRQSILGLSPRMEVVPQLCHESSKIFK